MIGCISNPKRQRLASNLRPVNYLIYDRDYRNNKVYVYGKGKVKNFNKKKTKGYKKKKNGLHIIDAE